MRATVLAALFASGLYAQTTQALITGRVQDSETGALLAGVTIRCVNEVNGGEWNAVSSKNGTYSVPLLPPASYTIRVTANGYQPREVRGYQIPVAGLVLLDFRLRALHDLWESGQSRSVFLPGTRKMSRFYGPDVDFSQTASFEPLSGQRNTLFASVSFLVSPREIELLPLPGRDIYSTLLLQPGVTSSSATARGLGLSVNGQRFTSSNILLDGMENNAYLTTGPLTTQAPEAVQEYRISTANFSPEYGGTAGYVVNAVIRPGGTQWHGLGYFNLNNEILNANEVTRRYAGLPRAPVKEIQPGGTIGGPLSQSVFAFFAADYLRNRGRGFTREVTLPSQTLVDRILRRPSGSPASRLFSRFRIPALNLVDPTALFGSTVFEPTESINRIQATGRLDWLATSYDRFFLRLAASRLDRPDFTPSPYPDFMSGLVQESLRVAGSWTGSHRRTEHEARVSIGPDRLAFERAHPEIPELESGDGVLLPSNPGSNFRQRGMTTELSYSAMRNAGRHSMKGGGGILFRGLTVYFGQPEGRYLFADVDRFSRDSPANFNIFLSRLESSATTLALPLLEQSYRTGSGYLFLQDSFVVSPRLVLSGGVRYDRFGPPRYVNGSREAVVQLGANGPPSDRIRDAQLVAPQSPDQAVYDGRTGSWQGRASFSLALRRSGATAVRGGFGLFADRQFENLWITAQTNSFVSGEAALQNQERDYLQSASTLLNTLYSPVAAPGKVLMLPAPSSRRVVAFEGGLRNPLVQSGFVSVEQRISQDWTVSAYAVFSRSRHLMVTDRVNRLTGSLRAANPRLPAVFYRSDDGFSRYRAFMATSSYQTRRYLLKVNYTWSSSVDNQSDALADDFDLLRTATSGGAPLPGVSAFTRNYDFKVDTGGSDFDQRHNLVFYSLWRFPPWARRYGVLLNDWTISQIAAIRSGFPFTVYSLPDFFGPVRYLNDRANLLCSSGYAIDQPLPSGRLLLRADCFANPASGEVGNTARNQFYGPGLFNLDFSISKSFRIPRLPETTRLILRADAYNVLNHANLNNPESRLFCDQEGLTGCAGVFGQARYGRREAAPAFPAQKPLVESGRRIQFLLRFQF